MKVNLTELLLFFDKLLPVTDEQQGVYWLQTQRADGLIITFAFSIYENYIDVIINNQKEVDIASLGLTDCSEVKVLDSNRKCLEVLHARGRCFLSLLESPILEYEEFKI